MINIIHPVAGALAILTITTFWLSTAVAELFASQAIVASIKTAIPWGFLLLIPALMAAAGSGFALTKGRRGPLRCSSRPRRELPSSIPASMRCRRSSSLREP
jgi:hypothetical protein